MSVLTRELIVECTGERDLENIVDMEILFNGFEEFAALEGCSNLRRLACIDNGLKRISNLQCLGMSLVTLCLCDQNLTEMDNLALPNLQELFLHRNGITKIGNLAGCPRLRKLWLFQNRIEHIGSALQAVPELEDCWLQSNNISRLQGIEGQSNLQHLGLAGNPVSDFKELKRLQSCPRLRSLTMSDIHFGRCPLADEDGYKEFVVLHLGQVSILDGLEITKEIQLSAQDIFYSQVKAFNRSLQDVEDAYQTSLRQIEAQYQSRESYSNVLEKEMSAALKELQGLVTEGRGVISNQVNRNKKLISHSAATMQHNLNELETQAKLTLLDRLEYVHNEFDISASLLSVLEQVASADTELVSVLTEASTAVLGGSDGKSNSDPHGISGGDNPAYATSSNSSSNTMPKKRKVIFQSISNNTADFSIISNLISPPISTSSSSSHNASSQAGNKKTNSRRNASNNSNNNNSGSNSGVFEDLAQLEITRLYKVSIYPSFGTLQDVRNPYTVQGLNSIGAAGAYEGGSISYDRMFTLLTPESLKLVLNDGWESLPFSPVFSPDADMMAALHDCVGMHMTQSLPDEYASVIRAENVEDNALVNLKNGHPGVGDMGNSSSSSGSRTNAEKLTRLGHAASTKLFMLVCCKVYQSRIDYGVGNNSTSNTSNKTSSGLNVTTMQLPVAEDLRKQLVHEFHKAKRPQRLLLSYKSNTIELDHDQNITHVNNSKGSSMIHLIPARVCGSTVLLDFIALCVSPPIAGGGVRSIDGRLEPLLLPANHIEHSGHILSTFERRAAEEVKHFLDKVLEEVDEDQATSLRNAEAEVMYREGSLKSMREEVERERRGQEALLRDMRQMSLNGQQGGGQAAAMAGDANGANSPLGHGNGGGGGTMLPSGSSASVGLQAAGGSTQNRRTSKR